MRAQACRRRTCRWSNPALVSPKRVRCSPWHDRMKRMAAASKPVIQSLCQSLWSRASGDSHGDAPQKDVTRTPVRALIMMHGRLPQTLVRPGNGLSPRVDTSVR